MGKFVIVTERDMLKHLSETLCRRPEWSHSYDRYEVCTWCGQHRKQNLWKSVIVPATREIVFGKRVDRYGKSLSIRVYTTLEPDGIARNKGSDAIRVEIVKKVVCAECDGGKCDDCQEGFVVKRVGGSKRINRVAGWGERLKERINGWEFLILSVLTVETFVQNGKDSMDYFMVVSVTQPVKEQ